jgi:hypothetical protein
MRHMTVIIGVLMMTSCRNAAQVTGTEAGLPTRTGEVDLSRVTSTLRSAGGSVFVQLTAHPTPMALELLTRAGLQPPPGNAQLVSFGGLRAVWGLLTPNGISPIAALPFVTRIEPSTDPKGIVPDTQ